MLRPVSQAARWVRSRAVVDLDLHARRPGRRSPGATSCSFLPNVSRACGRAPLTPSERRARACRPTERRSRCANGPASSSQCGSPPRRPAGATPAAPHVREIQGGRAGPVEPHLLFVSCRSRAPGRLPGRGRRCVPRVPAAGSVIAITTYQRDAGVGDPRLRAVQHVSRGGLLRARLLIGGVRSGLRSTVTRRHRGPRPRAAPSGRSSSAPRTRTSRSG